jgi:hypothetical protein
VTLDVLPGAFAVCRLSADSPLPSWASGGTFSSVTRTPHELSILCDGDAVPAEVQAQREFRALMVRGPLDFSLTGILAALAGALAAAAVSILPVSTYDTDYLFVRAVDLDRSIAALRAAGHTVVDA